MVMAVLALFIGIVSFFTPVSEGLKLTAPVTPTEHESTVKSYKKKQTTSIKSRQQSIKSRQESSMKSRQQV